MQFFRTLQCFLIAAVLAASGRPALAQGAPDPLPSQPQVDGNGVDLFTGEFSTSATDVVIGEPDAGGLAYGRVYSGSGWRPSTLGTIAKDGSTYWVSLGGSSDKFAESGGTFTSDEGAGATLDYDSGSDEYEYMAADGSMAVFDGALGGTLGALEMSPGSATGEAVLVSVTAPNGATTTYHYKAVTVSSADESRLQSVTNSFGYMLHFDYARDSDPTQSSELASWRELDEVTGINLKVDHCAPTANTCSGFTETWPSATYAGPTDEPTSVTDPEGRTTTYSYDGSGMLTGVKWPGSSSDNIAISYHTTGDCVGCVSKIDRGFADWDYTYEDDTPSTDKQTTTVSLPGSGDRVIVLNSDGLVESDTDPLSRTTNYLYDTSGRVTRVTMPEGNYIEYDYDGRGNVTETRAVAKSGSGLSDIVTSASYPSSCSNAKTCNKPTSTTDARGEVTNYTYDSAHGGLTSLKAPDPDGAGSLPRPETRYFYAQKQARYKNGSSSYANGPQIWVPAGTSACTTSAFDGAYNASKSHANNDCSAGDDDETVTSIAWPGTGSPQNLQPDSITAAAEDASVTSTTSFSYDAFGRLEFTDGPLSGTADRTRFIYNLAFEQIGTIGPDPDGGGSLKHLATRNTYDSSGLLIRVEQGTTDGYTDANWSSFTALQKAETEYDAHYRPIKQIAYSGASSTVLALTQTSYDNAGRPECSALRMNPSLFGSPPSSACSLGTAGSYGPDRIIKRVYNDAGQVTKQISAYGLSGLQQDTVTTTYTDNGRVETVTDAEGNKTTYEYDGFDRIFKTLFPHPSTAGTSSTTDYEQLNWSDAAATRGLLLSRRNRAGETITYSYDALGRMTDKTVPDGTGSLPYEYAYDNFGRRVFAGVQSFKQTYEYDALSRLRSMAYHQGSRPESEWAVIDYARDAAGRLETLTHPDGFAVDYNYDVLGRPTSVVEGANTLATVSYDDHGRRASLSYGNGTSVDYHYDGGSRLDELDWDLAGTGDDFSYDMAFTPSSQLASLAFSDSSLVWAPAAAGVDDYVANGLNQYEDIESASVSYDAAGNIATDHRGRSYEYTAENFLRYVKNGSTTLRYYLPWADGTIRYRSHSAARFYYDALTGEEIAETDNAGGGDFSGNNIVRRYIRLPGSVDEVLLMIDYTRDAGCTTTSYAACEVWAHADRLGSTVKSSDSTGNEIDTYTYSKYGESGPEGDSGFPFRFTGQKLDAVTGLYNYKNRWYDPEAGRFLQTDSIGYGDGMNLYAYTGNDPVNFVDPTGECRGWYLDSNHPCRRFADGAYNAFLGYGAWARYLNSRDPRTGVGPGYKFVHTVFRLAFAFAANNPEAALLFAGDQKLEKGIAYNLGQFAAGTVITAGFNKAFSITSRAGRFIVTAGNISISFTGSQLRSAFAAFDMLVAYGIDPSLLADETLAYIGLAALKEAKFDYDPETNTVEARWKERRGGRIIVPRRASFPVVFGGGGQAGRTGGGGGSVVIFDCTGESRAGCDTDR